MAQQYDIVYPPQGRVTFEGGLNNKFPRALIADNESPDTFNVVFTNGDGLFLAPAEPVVASRRASVLLVQFDQSAHCAEQFNRAVRSCTGSSAFSISTSRSVAPAARCNSPQISDRAPTAPDTITA